MNKKLFYGVGTILFLVLLGLVGYVVYQRRQAIEVVGTTTTTPIGNETQNALVYRNNTYGFSVPLPQSWRGYLVAEKVHDSYIEISIRHPESTPENPRMNIPVLVIPITTWYTWYPADGEGNHPFAAPIPATERARNEKYIFATAPRYNYSFAIGYEEVEEIVRRITVLSATR